MMDWPPANATHGPCTISVTSPVIGRHRGPVRAVNLTNFSENSTVEKALRRIIFQCHYCSPDTLTSCPGSKGTDGEIKRGVDRLLVSMTVALYLVLIFFLTVAKAMNEEQRISVCKTGLNQVYAMLRTSPQNYRNYLNLARTVIAHLDSTTFMQRESRTVEQAWMIAGLQRLASLDNGSGGTVDISAWCSRQWMTLYQRDSENVAALRGIGQAWLARAQPILARIHRVDGSSSSSGDSSQRSVISITSSEDDRLSAAAVAEAERRSGTQDYVEARSYLQPATEYLERAIVAATEQEILSGDLLATTAEAYMSLGNTSSPRTNEQYFTRALRLLRAASQVEGYTLSRYLQQYLSDFGRLVDG